MRGRRSACIVTKNLPRKQTVGKGLGGLEVEDGRMGVGEEMRISGVAPDGFSPIKQSKIFWRTLVTGDVQPNVNPPHKSQMTP